MIWYTIRYDMIWWYDVICDMIWCDMLWYDIWYMIRHDMIYDMIYLLDASGLTPSGSSTVHIYTQTVHRTKQWNNTYNGTYITVRIHNYKMNRSIQNTQPYMKWYIIEAIKCERSSDLHMICISSNNDRHPVTETFTPLHFTWRSTYILCHRLSRSFLPIMGYVSDKSYR
jgi:hypothetical protein